MVNFGVNSLKIFSRKYHLPSNKKLKVNDIAIIDVTSLHYSGNIWGNWCQTFSVGNNVFFTNLCEDVKLLTENLVNQSINANFIGDILELYNQLTMNSNLKLIGGNIGHNIFSVKKGQLVDKTPLSERVFIDENHADVKLENSIISIEPQFIRKNSVDGFFYGAKFQRNLIF